MVLELESEITGAIGLGMPPSYYNGSESCAPIREEAVNRLPNVLRQYARRKKVSYPKKSIIKLADLANRRELRHTTLTDTWKIASEVIRAHIEAIHMQRSQRTSFYESRFKQIALTYGFLAKTDERYQTEKVIPN